MYVYATASSASGPPPALVAGPRRLPAPCAPSRRAGWGRIVRRASAAVGPGRSRRGRGTLAAPPLPGCRPPHRQRPLPPLRECVHMPGNGPPTSRLTGFAFISAAEAHGSLQENPGEGQREAPSSAERFTPRNALAPAARTGAAGSRRHGAAAGSAVAREQRPPFAPAAKPAIRRRRRSRSVRRGRPARRISPHGKSEITPIRCRTMAYPRIYPLFAGVASDLATSGRMSPYGNIPGSTID